MVLWLTLTECIDFSYLLAPLSPACPRETFFLTIATLPIPLQNKKIKKDEYFCT